MGRWQEKSDSQLGAGWGSGKGPKGSISLELLLEPPQAKGKGDTVHLLGRDGGGHLGTGQSCGGQGRQSDGRTGVSKGPGAGKHLLCLRPWDTIPCVWVGVRWEQW